MTALHPGRSGATGVPMVSVADVLSSILTPFWNHQEPKHLWRKKLGRVEVLIKIERIFDRKWKIGNESGNHCSTATCGVHPGHDTLSSVAPRFLLWCLSPPQSQVCS